MKVTVPSPNSILTIDTRGIPSNSAHRSGLPAGSEAAISRPLIPAKELTPDLSLQSGPAADQAASLSWSTDMSAPISRGWRCRLPHLLDSLSATARIPICAARTRYGAICHLENNHVPCGDTLSSLKESRYSGVARHRVYKFQKLLSQGPDLVPKPKDGYVWILVAVRDRKGLADWSATSAPLRAATATWRRRMSFIPLSSEPASA